MSITRAKMVLMYLAANENLRLNRSYIELRSITLCRVGNQVRQVLCITFKQKKFNEKNCIVTEARRAISRNLNRGVLNKMSGFPQA